MEILTHPLVRSALTGMLAAAAVDFQAFRAWKSFNDALTYEWGTAIFRWVQGAMLGILTGLGMGAVFG